MTYSVTVMLRGSEKKKSELLKQLEESEKQIQRYETKLKGVSFPQITLSILMISRVASI